MSGGSTSDIENRIIQNLLLQIGELRAQNDANKRVLMVLTNNAKLGDTDETTGWYLSELAHPYFVFRDAGCEITLGSPLGGNTPADVHSIQKTDEVSKDFWEESELRGLTQTTKRLGDLDGKSFDAIFFVGGYGTMWDFPDNADVQRLAKEVYESGGVVSGVCHGPVALINVVLSTGKHLVKGKEVAAFTNEEEDQAGRRAIVPYTCHDKLRERGAKIKQAGVFQKQVAIASGLVTGQNPASAQATAEAVVRVLDGRWQGGDAGGGAVFEA